MTKQLTVTKLDKHSPQYGWVEFSDGVKGNYGDNGRNKTWFTRVLANQRTRLVESGKRVELLKQALAQAEG